MLARSPESMVVLNDMGTADAVRALPAHRFLEGIYDSSYTQTHFSASPIVLGWSAGYKLGC